MISMRINVQNMQTQHQTVWLDSPLQSNPNILFPIHQLKVLIAPYIQGRPGGVFSRPDKTNAFQVFLYKQF